MGVGKTAVSQQLKSDLPNSVFLDGDWCWDANPFQITPETKKMVIDNICYLLNNFLSCSAYENIIFCWVMHQQNIIDAITKRLDIQNNNVKIISLMADENTLRTRLNIDIKNGLRSQNILPRSLEKNILYLNLDTIKIDTCNKTIQMIADEIEKLS